MSQHAQLHARLEAVSIVLQEVCRSLAPAQLAAVAAASAERLALASATFSGGDPVDEAMSSEVARLLAALRPAAS